MSNIQGEGKIEWCDRTVNVVHGCTPIEHPEHPSACQRCYACRMAKRLAGRCGYPADDPFRVTIRPDRLPELLKAKPGERVFVPSMGDLFHEGVPFEFIAAVFGCFAARRESTFIILTKRPGRARLWFEWARSADRPFNATLPGNAFNRCQLHAAHLADLPFLPEGQPWPLPNVWFLATCESQYWLEQRIDDLLACPAVVHGISVEGMLGPMDTYHTRQGEGGPRVNVLGHWSSSSMTFDGLDWVVCGAEQGPGARPFDPKWARDLLKQCKAAGTPFFFKKGPDRSNPPAGLLVREWPEGPDSPW